MCGKPKTEGSLYDIMLGDDPLCSDCRKALPIHRKKLLVDGVKGESFYRYPDMSRILLQYKECGDEALKDVFLYPLRRRLHYRYAGYTMVLMPSSKEKREMRGFSHVWSMFAQCGLPMIEPFYKKINVDQKEHTAKDREKIRGMIGILPDIELPANLLLCDDVITTGSTLRAALSCLSKEDHELRILTCAYTEKHTAVHSHVLLKQTDMG